jgi:hypothetical protein
MRPGSPTNIAYFRAENNEKGLKTEAFPLFWADAQTNFQTHSETNFGYG